MNTRKENDHVVRITYVIFLTLAVKESIVLAKSQKDHQKQKSWQNSRRTVDDVGGLEARGWGSLSLDRAQADELGLE